MQASEGQAVALPVAEEETKQKTQPPYHVILLDDNDHTYEYVIRMLHAIFGHSEQRAYDMACEVDNAGRVIVITTTKEHAELKQDQIHSFGPDPLIAKCSGSMTAVLEPAEEK